MDLLSELPGQSLVHHPVALHTSQAAKAFRDQDDPVVTAAGRGPGVTPMARAVVQDLERERRENRSQPRLDALPPVHARSIR